MNTNIKQKFLSRKFILSLLTTIAGIATTVGAFCKDSSNTKLQIAGIIMIVIPDVVYCIINVIQKFSNKNISTTDITNILNEVKDVSEKVKDSVDEIVKKENKES